MPFPNRLDGRIVHLWHAPQSGSNGELDFHVSNYLLEHIGGLRVVSGLTNHDLFEMVSIILRCIPLEDLTIHKRDQYHIDNIDNNNNKDLEAGDYYVTTRNNRGRVSAIQVFDRLPVGNAAYHHVERPYIARQQKETIVHVRKRDRGCVLTKTPNCGASVGDWTGFEVAHIFPLYHELVDPDRITRDLPDFMSRSSLTGHVAHSPQNAILMRSDVHRHFSQYQVAINMDSPGGPKIVAFTQATAWMSGTRINSAWLAYPDRPPNCFWQWHYKESVLANVRWVGAPVYTEEDVQEDVQQRNNKARKPFTVHSDDDLDYGTDTSVSSVED
ncbi:hypothetical protein Sste5346_002020 [Sporothrix stenoceras]|uniref:HNH nuclease domain-containing protein n=1 Tax=Sporothrix stenoceras TaxID=5173 RepID=A0ABR3ZLE0_9PEZI